jgi:hypothetical protein
MDKEASMKFYTRQHKHYCGIYLHARSMHVYVLDQAGVVLVHKNIAAAPEPLLALIGPYREDLVIAVECSAGIGWPIYTRARISLLCWGYEGNPRSEGQERSDRLRIRSRRFCAAG